MAHANALDVRFVDNCLAPRDVRRAIVAPIEAVVDDHRLGHPARRVVHVTSEVLGSTAQPISEDRRAPINFAAESARIRIDEQLVRIESITFTRRIATMYSVAIQLPWPDAQHVAVPDVARLLRQSQTRGLLAIDVVEQAQLDMPGVLRKSAGFPR